MFLHLIFWNIHSQFFSWLFLGGKRKADSETSINSYQKPLFGPTKTRQPRVPDPLLGDRAIRCEPVCEKVYGFWVDHFIIFVNIFSWRQIRTRDTWVREIRTRLSTETQRLWIRYAIWWSVYIFLFSRRMSSFDKKFISETIWIKFIFFRNGRLTFRQKNITTHPDFFMKGRRGERH